MTILNLLLASSLAAASSPEEQARGKLIFGIIALVGGALALYTGIMFVRKREADITGKPVLTALRGTSKFEGKSAVTIGYVRIVLGVIFLIVGVVVLATR